MEVGLVGLPFVGKTTLFHALTQGAHAAGGGGGALKPNIGVASIPDKRLHMLAEHIPTRKLTPATVQIVDIAGLAPGEGHASRFLDHIRKVDAICHVVPCFEDELSQADGGRRPQRDIDAIETEMILADLQVVESALPKAERSARAKDAKALARLATLRKVSPLLEDGQPVRAALGRGELAEPGEQAALRELGLITAKKVLYVANVGEEDATGDGDAAQQVLARARTDHMEGVCICAKVEAELVELEEADRLEMLEAMGLGEPALPALAAGLHRLLGLTPFYTAGEKEIRAWMVRTGCPAKVAAGAIHSDIERGFIRAEVYSVDDLMELKTEKAIREAGKMRVEGKEYAMRDADVVNFLFNV